METQLLINNTYENGQTDGMKLYRIETAKDVGYVFATNKQDAKTKFKAKLTIPYHAYKEYLNRIY